MAVQVLAVLAYHEGDRVTSAGLACSVNTNPVIIRRLLLSLQKATPARRPSTACPVGHCIRETLAKVFASARVALERDLARTSLADVLTAVKTPVAGARKKAG